MNHTQLARRTNRQWGSSLLEVLVAVLLMSFGMLALGGMQAYSVAAQKNAANRAIATSLGNEMAEIIRLNRQGLAAGNYNVTMMTNTELPTVVTCAFPDCNTPAKLARADLTAFQTRVRRQLPLGGIEISLSGVSTTQADLWILWQEASVLNNMVADGDSTQSAEQLADNCSATAKNLPILPRCFYMKVQL
jgi:type IV pilus assembly protein PilV